MTASEKVDILWEYPQHRKAVQVKSSQNQIGLRAVTTWAEQLETSTVADEYELRLIGPCSSDVASCSSIGAVSIPSPEAENLPAFLERAAHKLDHYLSALSPPIRLSPRIRELIAGALAQRLAEYSTQGRAISRTDFIATVSSWISEIRKTAGRLYPTRLPRRRNPFFVAREDLIAAIDAAFASPSGVATIQVLAGLGGVGKTQTAIEYAYRKQPDYQHIFFIDASTEATLHEGLAQVADELSIAQAAEGRAAASSSALSWLTHNEGWLLILDNADEPELIGPYTVPLSHGHVILTSRASVFDLIGVVSPFIVGPLTNEEAVRFICKRTGKEPLTESELHAIREICHSLGGLPLALEQAGAYIHSRKVSFESYLVTWKTKRLELLERASPVTGDYEKTVGTTWLVNFDAVRETSSAAFDVLLMSAFLYRDRIPLDFIAATSSLLSESIHEALADFHPESNPLPLDELTYPLTSLSLIYKDSETVSFSVHPLVQDALLTTVDAAEATSWRRKLLRAFASVFPDGGFETSWLSERLYRHAMTVLSRAKDEEVLTEEAGSVMHRCAQFSEETGDYKLAASVYLTALKIRHKVLPANHPDLGATLNNFGVAIQRMGYYKDAEGAYRKALSVRLAARGPEHRDVAQTLNNLGMVLTELGRFAESESCFRDALPILKRAGVEDTSTLAICKANLAGVLELQGQSTESYSLLLEALELQERHLGPDHPAVWHTTKLMVNRLDSQGRREEALSLLTRVMEKERTFLGERHPEYSRSLLVLGTLLSGKGDVDGARAAYKAAGDAITATNGPRQYEMGAVHSNIADLDARKGDSSSAIEQYRLALDIFRDSIGPDHVNVANVHLGLGHCYLAIQNYAEAEMCYKECLRVYKMAHGRNHNRIGVSLSSLAFVAAKAGQQDVAARLFAEAFEVYQALGFPRHADCVDFLKCYIRWLRYTRQDYRVPPVSKLLAEVEQKAFSYRG